MIDQSLTRGPGETSRPDPGAPLRLPVPTLLGRTLVLTTVFVCAACGLVYELELVALASYLAGDSVTHASVVLSVMVFGMGLGSLLAKRLCGRAALGFGLVEAVLALVGGASAMALYAAFAWLGQPLATLVAFSTVIGVLIGAEIPLLMALIQRIRQQDAEGAVADLFAADYVGALVGGLAFPFLLLPLVGQLTGALLTGAVNVAAGAALVLWLFRNDLPRRSWWLLFTVNAVVLALLAAGMLSAEPFERAARRAMYGQDVRVAVRTEVQEIVLTGRPGAAGHDGPSAVSLYLDGQLRVKSGDDYRYHEALVHPAMGGGPRHRVAVLGGGDGLALREVLRYPNVESVTVVDLDAGLVRLARTDPGLVDLNNDAFDDPRVRVVAGDAFNWLRHARSGPSGGPYDVVIADLPDPAMTASTKLYSVEFYGLVARLLAPGGRFVTHAGSPSATSRVFWTAEATVRAAGLETVPYRLTGLPLEARPGLPVRAFGGGRGDWGFVLAARDRPRLRLPDDPHAPQPLSLTKASLRSAARAAEHTRVDGLPPSTLMHPRFVG